MIINWKELNVQQHWNELELVIIDCVDCCAPLSNIEIKPSGNAIKVTSLIKNKINIKKRLLQLDRLRSSTANGPHIKILNRLIGSYFSGVKASGVRQAAMGNIFRTYLFG